MPLLTRPMRLLNFVLPLLLTTGAGAEIKTRTVTYTHNEVELRGHLAYAEAPGGRRPGVLVIHEWWGINDYARKRAEQLASMGYVALAVDMYGDGKATQHPSEAGQWAKQVQQNTDLWRQRALTGLAALRKQPQVDPDRIVAIGYCFGGASVLQLAYSGAEVAGVVSFHGSLPAPAEDDLKRIKAKILICHGAQDGFIPDERIAALRDGLDEAGADWQMVWYGGAVHSFTNRGADKRNVKGLAYDEKADRRSWGHMKMFFDEILKR
jgi:dienelactone hydrolase